MLPAHQRLQVTVHAITHSPDEADCVRHTGPSEGTNCICGRADCPPVLAGHSSRNHLWRRQPDPLEHAGAAISSELSDCACNLVIMLSAHCCLQVTVHVVTRSPDGQNLWSTREQFGGSGLPLAFVMGKGRRVPRGWELALYGEVQTCQAQ